MNIATATAIYAGATEGKAVYYGPQLLWNVEGWEPLPTDHAIIEGLTEIDGSRGHSTFVNNGYSLKARSLSFMGFKIAGFPAPSPRIKNCAITLDSGVYNFGVSTNWDLVRYFQTHDLTITADGIGRSNQNNLGGGWQDDVCGFYLLIPTADLQNTRKIIVDYEYTSSWANKHGVAFWGSVSGAVGGGINSDWIGTWVETPYARLSSEITRSVVIPQAEVTSGTLYRRRVIILNTP